MVHELSEQCGCSVVVQHMVKARGHALVAVAEQIRRDIQGVKTVSAWLVTDGGVDLPGVGDDQAVGPSAQTLIMDLVSEQARFIQGDLIGVVAVWGKTVLVTFNPQGGQPIERIKSLVAG